MTVEPLTGIEEGKATPLQRVQKIDDWITCMRASVAAMFPGGDVGADFVNNLAERAKECHRY